MGLNPSAQMGEHVMGKPTPVTEEQLEWLREAVANGITRREMAAYMQVCEDTVRRILHKNMILEFDGAKFHNLPPIIQWCRPCMYCKCTKERPKNQYICDCCKSRIETW